MWTDLPINEREEYKRMILSFASLTEMFAQKADEDTILSPIINSKYQETVFQKVFNAVAEDIGNTSYDASLVKTNADGTVTKYLVGIKTFGYGSGDQKVAQFKANLLEWSEIIGQMTANGFDEKGRQKTREEINKANESLYYELAKRIAVLRNMRIDSSEAGLQGFSVSVKKDDDMKAVYHFLMPSPKGEIPFIYVGETNYDRIRIDNIKILGCTSAKNPANFDFTDGNHKYRYTAADSQLLMNFDNKNTAIEKWDVIYAEDAYEIFSEIGNRIFGIRNQTESYSWLIENKNGEVERFSGFNGFYGVGSKLSKDTRVQRVNNIKEKFEDFVPNDVLKPVIDGIKKYLTNADLTREEKVGIRNQIMTLVLETKDNDLLYDVTKLIFRPQSEMYIPLPNSVKFHSEHPDFFGKGLGVLKKVNGVSKLVNKGRFTLVFEPSGDSCEAFITQDGGKAIESCEKQSILGEWVLRKVFQLAPYEPLTAKRLYEVGKNGIRIWKYKGKNEIHIQFVWIDKNDLPNDYIG